jgi:hypothetical protein
MLIIFFVLGTVYGSWIPPSAAIMPNKTIVFNSQSTYQPTVAVEQPTMTRAPKYPIRQPYVLELKPFVKIGVSAVRPGPPRNPPPGHRVVCPSDRAYCIDYKASDNGTCMYPDPIEIKACYDSSCVNSAWNPVVFRVHGENSYCKDFMTPAGRVCQWADGQACTCDAKSIQYYDAEFIPPGESIPEGYSEVYPCTYPLDVIRRAAEEAARKAREKRSIRERQQQTGRPRRRSSRSSTEETESSDSDSSNSRNNAQRRRSDDDDESSNPAQSYSTSILVAILALSIIVH